MFGKVGVCAVRRMLAKARLRLSTGFDATADEGTSKFQKATFPLTSHMALVQTDPASPTSA